jgi:hypothetical protein
VGVDEFMRDGYLVVRDAFDADVVAARRDAIWAHLAAYGVRPDDPAGGDDRRSGSTAGR